MLSDMSNVKTTGNWQVKRASVSERNGGLYLEGFNHHTAEPFFWHIDTKAGLDNPEYDFAGCDWQPGSLTVGARILDRAN